MRRGRTLGLFVAALVLLASTVAERTAIARGDGPAKGAPASPASGDARAVAREHYKRGITAYNLGEYDRAVDELKKAYELSSAPSLLFNIAQALRLKRDHAQALLFYRNYLRLEPNAPNRADAEALALEMQEKAAADERAAAEAKRRAEEEARAQRATDDKQPNGAAQIVVVAPPPVTPPPKRSVASKWWFWTALVGTAAVAATAISVGVIYGTPERLPGGTLGTIDGR